MKRNKKIVLGLIGIILLIIISIQGYNNFMKNKKRKELGEELKLFDSGTGRRFSEAFLRPIIA
jgi:hypothetical protein